MRSHQSISSIIAIRLAAIAVAITLISIFIIGLIDYRREISQANAILDQVEVTSVRGIEASLWELNHSLLKVQVDGITHNPNVKYVAVYDVYDNGRIIAESGQPVNNQVGQIQRRIPLYYLESDQKTRLGELLLVVDLWPVTLSFLIQLLQLFVIILAIITALGVAFFTLFERMVGRNLTTIVQHLSEESSISQSPQSWKPIPSKNMGKELSKVVDTINDMHGQIHRSLLDLKDAEKRYRNIFENAIEGIFQSTPDGKLTLSNPAHASIFGYGSPEELLKSVGHVNELYVFPEKRAEFRKLLDEKGAIKNYEGQFYRKDRTIFWGSVNARAIQDEQGRLLYYEGTISDITKEKELEQAYLNAEERYRNIFDNSVEGIFQSTPEGQLLLVNSAAAGIFGYESTEEMLNSIRDVTPYYVDTRKRNEFKRLLQEQGYVKHFETQVYRKDKSIIWISLNARTVKDSLGEVHHYDGSFEDITGRKLLEEQFLQSQKMEIIGQMAGGIAHDFNNILTVINGFSSLLMIDPNLDPESLKKLNQIMAAGERGAKLTGQLLTISRKKPVQKQILNLNHVIQDMSRLLESSVGENILLILDLDKELPSIMADSGMIEQILLNLAINARDAMRKGGQLIFKTRKLTSLPQNAGIGSEAGVGGFVHLSVRDEGIGISANILPRIFDPFFTTKEIGKGTGLGLATVFAVIKQNNGRIEVETEPGQGTTFHCYFPALPGTTPSDSTHIPGTKIPVGNEWILVVEDEKSVRDLTIMILKNYGYQVLNAGSGDEALDVWKENSSKISLLLTDIVMPGGLTGWELARQLREVNPNLKVVHMSGYLEPLPKEITDTWDKISFLQKPFRAEDLARIIRETLDDDSKN